MSLLVYFSSSSTGNTKQFIEKLALPAVQLGCSNSHCTDRLDVPFILVCPTYADGRGRGAVPGGVIQFLNYSKNRALMRGIIASGNRNFGPLFARAGDIIARKCHVPVLYRFELAGTEKDIMAVRQGLTKFWSENSENHDRKKNQN